MKHWLIFTFFLSSFGYAQVNGMLHYGQEEGLDASVTYVIDQDRNGFIWIGTDNGLYRFDGSEFKQYAQKEGLSNIDVLQPIALGNGDVFILPFASDIAVQRQGKIITPKNNAELSKIKTDGERRFLVQYNPTRTQVAIFKDGDPRHLYIYKNGRVRDYPVLLPKSDFGTTVICYDFDGKLILMDGLRIIEYNVNTHKLSKFTLRDNNNLSQTIGFNGFRFASFFQFSPGLFAQRTDNKLRIIQKASGQYHVINEMEFREKIYYISEQDSDKFWVSFANGGAALVDMHRKTPDAVIIFLPEYIINYVKMDRDGNIWFSTKTNGIFFMPRQQFENYQNSQLGRDFAPVTAIASNNSDIFLGYNTAEAGIYRKGMLQKITLEPGLKIETKGIFPTRNYVTFSNESTYRMSLSNLSEKRRIFIRGTKNVVKASPDKAIFCTNESLLFYEPEIDKKTFLDKIRCYSAVAYGDSLLIGTFSDVYKFDIHTRKKQKFLSKVFFTDMKPLGKNRFIAATNGYGICLFDNHKICSRLTESDGLASNQVKKLYLQNDNIVWASTNSGLSRISFDGKIYAISTFTRMEGLPSDRVSDCVVRNDTVFAATSKGVAALPLSRLLRTRPYLEQMVFINSVVVGKREYIQPKRKLSVDYSDNSVVFNLSFPDYISQGKIGYRYRINGLSTQWQTVNSSKIVLNALAPGKYRLEVYGMSYNAKRSKHSTAFSFEIKPLFWQAIWFKVICILLIGAMISWGIIYAIQRRRAKKLKAILYDKKIAELELQAIKAQINPHFIYNCLNSIKYLLYKKDYPETENYLDVFARMIRSTLHYSEKTFMPVRDEIEYLRLYLDMEKLRFKSQFSYEINAGREVYGLEIPSLLIQPFVENAIKHGIANLKERKGKISISFAYHDSILEVTITDNGVGITDKSILSSKLDSYGIRLSQKRVDAFRQLFGTNITLHIYDLSERGSQGTEIKLKLYQS